MGGTNEKQTKEKRKDENTTQHERAFIVLCIYAIVYVSLWRIWKYMLTNLYRVFYVMWNTWSRCSLVSRALVFWFSFVYFFSPLFHLKQHIRRTRWLLTRSHYFSQEILDWESKLFKKNKQNTKYNVKDYNYACLIVNILAYSFILDKFEVYLQNIMNVCTA